MSYGDKVSVLYNEKLMYGTIVNEYSFGKIVHIPLIKEQKFVPFYKITEWADVDWITKVQLLNDAKEIKWIE